MFGNVNHLFSDLKEYVNLRIDVVKLQCVESLSVVSGRLLGMIVTIMMWALALVMLIAAVVILLAWWLDSFLWAFLIMFALLFVAACIVYRFRKRLFVGSFVKSLCSMLFEEDEEEQEV